MDIFTLPQHLLIPLFQRPYVWDEEEQWSPLWSDIRRVAELKLDSPTSSATHFFGAVVLQAQENKTGTLQTRQIIDGQQRLTTLQIVMDATAAALETRGEDNLARRLEELTHNPSHYIQDQDDLLKLRHTNRDRASFDEVMKVDPPIDYDALQHSNLIQRAHSFFNDRVEEWLGPESGSSTNARGEALTASLTRGLQLVVIDLSADENSQEIFETLNARGTPLTAADLIKNYVFKTLAAEGADTDLAYRRDWPFESRFWEQDVSVGRYSISRSSNFLNQWLVSRTGEQIGPRQTFSRFKHFAEHETSTTMSALLNQVKQQADLYQFWTERASDSHAQLNAVELAMYRMQSSDLETLKPILIWLHEPGLNFEPSVIDRVVQSCESWVFRRALLRLPTGDLGRVVADLISENRSAPSTSVVDNVVTQLMSLDSSSTYWPGDAEIKKVLASEPVYRKYKRGRLRIFLEAAEDHLRGFTTAKPLGNGRVPRAGYPIEHIMPQSWEAHWPLGESVSADDRAQHIHRFGNLTLLTQGLNSKVSNAQWAGPSGKRTKLNDHDLFLLNRRLLDMSSDTWDELLIDERTEAIVDSLLATWQVPDGHAGVVKDVPSVATSQVTTKQLVSAGLLAPGTVLQGRRGTWPDKPAVVGSDGTLTVGEQVFTSPSGAGRYVKNGVTNGWSFWRLPDGKQLAALRDEYVSGSRTG